MSRRGPSNEAEEGGIMFPRDRSVGSTAIRFEALKSACHKRIRPAHPSNRLL